MAKTFKVFALDWTLYEHDGWAQQEDNGTSLHTTKEKAEEYRISNAKGPYECFTRAHGSVYEIEVDKQTYDKIVKNKGTLHVHDLKIKKVASINER